MNGVTDDQLEKVVAVIVEEAGHQPWDETRPELREWWMKRLGRQAREALEAAALASQESAGGKE